MIFPSLILPLNSSTDMRVLIEVLPERKSSKNIFLLRTVGTCFVWVYIEFRLLAQIEVQTVSCTAYLVLDLLGVSELTFTSRSQCVPVNSIPATCHGQCATWMLHFVFAGNHQRTRLIGVPDL